MQTFRDNYRLSYSLGTFSIKNLNEALWFVDCDKTTNICANEMSQFHETYSLEKCAYIFWWMIPLRTFYNFYYFSSVFSKIKVRITIILRSIHKLSMNLFDTILQWYVIKTFIIRSVVKFVCKMYCFFWLLFFKIGRFVDLLTILENLTRLILF